MEGSMAILSIRERRYRSSMYRHLGCRGRWRSRVPLSKSPEVSRGTGQRYPHSMDY
jgi:hypothetical protein